MRAGAAIRRVRGLVVLPLIAAAAAAIPAGQARASASTQVQATTRALAAGAVPGAVLSGTGVLDDVVATGCTRTFGSPLARPLVLHRTSASGRLSPGRRASVIVVRSRPEGWHGGIR